MPDEKDNTLEDETKPTNSDFPTTWDEVFEHPRFKQLYAQNAELKSKLADLESQRKAEDTKRLEEQEQWKELAEQSKQELADLQAKVAASELSALRLKIGTELGLPVDLSNRLSGDDEESIRKDAETMVQYSKPVAPQGTITEGGKGTPPTPKGLSDMSVEEIVGMSADKKKALIENSTLVQSQ